MIALTRASCLLEVIKVMLVHALQ